MKKIFQSSHRLRYLIHHFYYWKFFSLVPKIFKFYFLIIPKPRFPLESNFSSKFMVHRVTDCTNFFSHKNDLNVKHLRITDGSIQMAPIHDFSNQYSEKHWNLQIILHPVHHRSPTPDEMIFQNICHPAIFITQPVNTRWSSYRSDARRDRIIRKNMVNKLRNLSYFAL